jgi:hypothetical protein
VYINVREYRRGNNNEQFRISGSIGHTRQRKIKQKHNTICVEHHYAQTNKQKQLNEYNDSVGL